MKFEKCLVVVREHRHLVMIEILDCLWQQIVSGVASLSEVQPVLSISND
jgi:hypothetical protein